MREQHHKALQPQVTIMSNLYGITHSLVEATEKGKCLKKKSDCPHQDSNQGPSLEASDALTTELRCIPGSRKIPPWCILYNYCITSNICSITSSSNVKCLSLFTVLVFLLVLHHCFTASLLGHRAKHHAQQHWCDMPGRGCTTPMPHWYSQASEVNSTRPLCR